MTYDKKYLKMHTEKTESNLFQQKEKIHENCSNRRHSYFQTVFPELLKIRHKIKFYSLSNHFGNKISTLQEKNK